MPKNTPSTSRLSLRDVLQAVVGFGAGGYIGIVALPYDTASRWVLVGAYAIFTVILLVFGWLRSYYRTMFIATFVGMTLAMAVMVFR